MDESAPHSSLVNMILSPLLHAGSRQRVIQDDKTWGVEYIINLPLLLLKIIRVNDGKRTSLQHHDVKDEVIFILDGEGTIEGSTDDELGRPRPSPGYRIQPGTIHRSVGPVLLLELSTRHPYDVVRWEDDHGRVVRCACGCNEPVNLNKHTGKPNKFVNGHNGSMQDKSYMQSLAYRALHRGKRNAAWKTNVTYARAHGRIDQAKGGKTGICEFCDTARLTQWAFTGPNGSYSINPIDYRELCVPCHRRYDQSKT